MHIAAADPAFSLHTPPSVFFSLLWSFSTDCESGGALDFVRGHRGLSDYMSYLCSFLMLVLILRFRLSTLSYGLRHTGFPLIYGVGSVALSPTSFPSGTRLPLPPFFLLLAPLSIPRHHCRHTRLPLPSHSGDTRVRRSSAMSDTERSSVVQRCWTVLDRCPSPCRLLLMIARVICRNCRLFLFFLSPVSPSAAARLTRLSCHTDVVS